MADIRNCFIVGPISEAGSATRKLADLLLKLIIKPVLEADDLNYRVKRADEDADPGSITSALITDLINADLVIADLTGFNPNAFYELGIRHAIQKPTIHMIAQQATLPFDNKDQRTIFVDMSDFDNMESAKASLRSAVSAIDAEGYTVSNPVTQAKAVAALKESGDPRDSLIANMEERLARLEKSDEIVRLNLGAGKTTRIAELLQGLRSEYGSEPRELSKVYLDAVFAQDAARRFPAAERDRSMRNKEAHEVLDDLQDRIDAAEAGALPVGTTHPVGGKRTS